MIFEHAVSDLAIAINLLCNGQVIVVSLKQVVVDSEVGVAALHHVLQVLNHGLLSLAHLVEVSQVSKFIFFFLGKFDF